MESELFQSEAQVSRSDMVVSQNVLGARVLGLILGSRDWGFVVDIGVQGLGFGGLYWVPLFWETTILSGFVCQKTVLV